MELHISHKNHSGNANSADGSTTFQGATLAELVTQVEYDVRVYDRWFDEWAQQEGLLADLDDEQALADVLSALTVEQATAYVRRAYDESGVVILP